LLSGGKDCGFESHWCRIFDFPFAFLPSSCLFFSSFCPRCDFDAQWARFNSSLQHCSVEPVTAITTASYTIISKRGTLQLSLPKSEGDPSRASAFLHTLRHAQQHQVTSRYPQFGTRPVSRVEYRLLLHLLLYAHIHWKCTKSIARRRGITWHDHTTLSLIDLSHFMIYYPA
jgi:hypothetical protein